MDVTGIAASFKNSVSHGLIQAAGGATRFGAPTQQSPGDPMEPGAFISPYSGYDRTVTTTIDEIDIKIAVKRLAKPSTTVGGEDPQTDSASQTVHIEVTTVDNQTSGQKNTTVVVDAGKGATSPLSDSDIQNIVANLDDDKGIFKGAVRLADHRTTTTTTYSTQLVKDSTGHLVSSRQQSTQSSSLDLSESTTQLIAFDATNANVGSASEAASNLLAQYVSPTWLETNIPGLSLNTLA